jgi:hypothetical protein
MKILNTFRIKHWQHESHNHEEDATKIDWKLEATSHTSDNSAALWLCTLEYVYFTLYPVVRSATKHRTCQSHREDATSLNEEPSEAISILEVVDGGTPISVRSNILKKERDPPTLIGPATVTMHTKRNGYLDEDGRGVPKELLKNPEIKKRIVSQTRIRSSRNDGAQVPRFHTEAVRIDEKNGNTDWQNTERIEMSQLAGYQVFDPTPKGLYQ